MELSLLIPNECRCKSDYYGKNCDFKLCDLNTYGQCKNKAICIQNVTSGVPTCECVPGYFGPLCEFPLEFKCRDYCANNGECIINPNDFSLGCKCDAARYSGDKCQFDKCIKKKDDCPAHCYMDNSCNCLCGEKCNYNYCNYNNGTCYDNGGKLACRCKAGYSNPICLIDDCRGYCFNGGFCQRHENSISHHFNKISCL